MSYINSKEKIKTTKMKRIALGLLAALATLAPAANAKYVDKHGNTFYTPEDFTGAHAVIVEQLYEIGVPVVDGRGTDLCENENILGWYTGQKDFMVICYGDYNLRAETLTHEAVHVVQDCRDGLSNHTLEDPTNESVRFWARNMGRKADLIVNTYDEEDWAIEAEAFYYETRPAAVSDDLHRSCGATEWK